MTSWRGPPSGLSHRHHKQLNHQTQGLINSQPDLLQQLLGARISPRRAARNGSLRISAPHAQGTMARVSLGGSSCHTWPRPLSEHSPSCSLWLGRLQVFPAIRHHPRLAGPTGDTLLQPWKPQGTRQPLGTKQGPAEAAVPWQAGGPAPKGHQQLNTPPLCTSCWKRFPFCGSKSQLK